MKEFHFVVTLNNTQKASIVVTSSGTKARNEEFPSMGFTSSSVYMLDYYREGFYVGAFTECRWDGNFGSSKASCALTADH
jgi:hypothetical protein